MTDTPEPADPAPSSPLTTAAAVVAVLGVVGAVLAVVRPWGDTGVTGSGALSDAAPVGHQVLLGVVTLAALVAAVVGRRRRTRTLGAAVVALGAVAVIAVLAVTTAQVLPRDGGWWGLLSAVASGVSGLLLTVGSVPVRGSRVGLVTLAVAVVVPVALVVAGVVVAPGWAGHVVQSSHPAAFSESPGPATVTRAAWRQDFGADSVSAVLGGRVVVAQDREVGGHCHLTVRALDAGTGGQVWSSSRDTRCNGPALAAVDGNNSIVRLTLRGPRYGETALTGPPTYLYLGTEDGRIVEPSSALDAVQWWTEGFGLVAEGGTVQGLDARTGVTLWSRPLPRCTDGSTADLRLPTAPVPGRLEARTPYDQLDAVPGSQRASGTGTDVVLALACGSSPMVWLVDAQGGARDDRVVALPIETTRATTFLPWLDAVVAVVATSAPSGPLHAATLFGISLATGRVSWVQALGDLTSIDMSPVDGHVTASRFQDLSSAAVAVDVHDGRVLGTTTDTSPYATVALTKARVEFGPAGLTVVGSGGGGGEIPLPDCRITVPDGNAAALAGPGGVVVRCSNAPHGAGSLVVGLAP